MAMRLTTEQVAEKLGVKRGTVNRLVKAGELAIVNPSPNGKRVEHRFDPAVVNEFKKTYAPRGHGGSRRNGDRPPALALSREGISASPFMDGPGMIRQQLMGLDATQQAQGEQLTRIEQLLAQLVKAWT